MKAREELLREIGTLKRDAEYWERTAEFWERDAEHWETQAKILRIRNEKLEAHLRLWKGTAP